MATLIKDLLSFSALINLNENREKVNLQETITKVLEDYEIVIKEKGAIVTCTSLPIVYAQPVQMNQLFSNLINNALKFSKENPAIKIAGREANKQDFIKIS